MKFTICIPTYNRDGILDKWFKKHCYLSGLAEVKLIIFDNNSSDNTQFVVNKWKAKYKNLEYVKHGTTVKAEDNFERCINYVRAGYCFPIGDSYFLSESDFRKLEQYLKFNSPEVLIININGRLDNVSKDSIDIDDFSHDLCGVASCIGSVVYKRSDKDFLFIDKEITNFCPVTHIGRVVKSGSQVSWQKEITIRSIVGKRKNWSQSEAVFDIAIDNWCEAVDFVFIDEQRARAYRSFGKISNLFSVYGLVKLRSLGLLDNSIFKKHGNVISVIQYSKFKIRLISILPIYFCKYVVHFAERFK